MGIFSRFRDIVSSNINAMLDNAEDPEKLIKMMIREMEDTLIELKASCAGVIAGKKKIERRLDDLTARAALWKDRAKLAVEKGRDDLAREALIEKRRFREMAEALEQELIGHTELIDQYQADIRELEDKLTSAKEKQRLLAQRHKRANGKRKAQENIRRMDSAETMARFDRLESRIEQMEAEAELVNFGRETSSDAMFDELATDAEIERELERIKTGKAGEQEDQP